MKFALFFVAASVFSPFSYVWSGESTDHAFDPSPQPSTSQAFTPDLNDEDPDWSFLEPLPAGDINHTPPLPAHAWIGSDRSVFELSAYLEQEERRRSLRLLRTCRRAIERRDLALLREVVEGEGLALSATDLDGETPVGLAARHNFIEGLRYLIQVAADRSATRS
jgi:hypothetical protein